MTRGLYIAGTGMMLQRRAMEVTINNIANADTTSYKKDTSATHQFDEVLVRRLHDMGRPVRSSAVGNLSFGAQVDELYIDFTEGAFEETGRATDFALEGDVFFAVETPAGVRYTRDGAFYTNADGYLIDANGNFPLDESGKRIYSGNTESFSVASDGTIFADGYVAGRFRVVSFADNLNLRKQGDNLYFSATAPEDQTKRYSVLQGFLESSNVDIAREMVDMMTTYRAYEANQKMVTMIDEINGRAASDIGRLR